MVTKVLANGLEWGEYDLYEGWGNVPDSWVVELADMSRERFHELCRERGIDAFWTPVTSEVVGGANQDITPERLETIRDLAMNDVWYDFVEGKLVDEMPAEPDFEW